MRWWQFWRRLAAAKAQVYELERANRRILENDGHLKVEQYRLEKHIEALGAELDHTHRSLETAQELAVRLQIQLAEERKAFASVTERILEGFTQLRRDGFNLATNYLGRVEPGVEGAAKAEVTTEDAAAWDKILEAIQERSGGDPRLQSTLTADALNWRSAKVPLKDIERRIYDGWEG